MLLSGRIGTVPVYGVQWCNIVQTPDPAWQQLSDVQTPEYSCLFMGYNGVILFLASVEWIVKHIHPNCRMDLSNVVRQLQGQLASTRWRQNELAADLGTLQRCLIMREILPGRVLDAQLHNFSMPNTEAQK